MKIEILATQWGKGAEAAAAVIYAAKCATAHYARGYLLAQDHRRPRTASGRGILYNLRSNL